MNAQDKPLRRRRPLSISAFCVTALLLSALGLHADVVYLKNKSAVRGEVIAQDDKTVTLRVTYGRIIIQRDHIDRIETEDDLKRLLGEANRLMMAGDNSGAETKYVAILKRFPDNDTARRRLAKILHKRASMLILAQKTAQAEPVLKRLIKLDPTDELARTELGRIQDVRTNADALETEAILLARIGRGHEALKKFDKLVRVLPDLEVRDARFIAQAHVSLANELLPIDHFRAASEHFEEAVRLDPTRAPALVKKRLVSILEPITRERKAHNDKLSSQRWEELARELENAESIDPENVLPLYALGEVYVKLHRYRDAAERFARISNSTVDWTKPRTSLKKLYDMAGNRVRKARLVVNCDDSSWTVITPKMQVLESKHFTIHHHNTELAQLAAKAAEYFYERTYKQLKTEVPINTWRKKCAIYIYSSHDEYLKQSGQESWSHANAKTVSAGGILKDHRIMTFQTVRSLLSSHIPHELTHIIQAAMFDYSTRIPVWLKEGLAVHNEPWFKHRFLSEVLKNEMDSDKAFTLEQLTTQKGYPDEVRVPIFYAQSLALVETLLDLKDMQTFNRFTRLTISLPFPEALDKSYGMTPQALTEHWTRMLDKLAANHAALPY